MSGTCLSLLDVLSPKTFRKAFFMKKLILFALIILTVSHINGQMPDNLPQIGVRQTITFSPTYSCRSSEEFHQKGYEGTALFLSDAMKRLNNPDLVFNGACNSKNYFQIGQGGNFALIADLGRNTITPHLLSLISIKGRSKSQNLKKLGFKQKVPIVAGHTYAAIVDKKEARGLFVLTVTDFIPDNRVKFSYEVLEYQVLQNGWVGLNSR